MEFSEPLTKAKLVKRYKRFLADVELETGELVTAHCPNTGSMKTCGLPGDLVGLARSDNPKRKLAYTWELTACEKGYIGINTARTNRLVAEAWQLRKLTSLSDYDKLKAEVRYGTSSRIDFLLGKSTNDKDNCFVEVKNVTLLGEEATALFPDAVTSRGLKHLKNLGEIASSGVRAVLLFVVNRPDVDKVSLACDIDAAYCEQMKKSLAAGMEVLCLQTVNSLESTFIDQQLPFVFS